MAPAVKPKGEIHLADLISALASLPWQDEGQAQAIAGCLGFGLAAPRVQPERPSTTIFDPRVSSSKPSRSADAKRTPWPMPPTPAAPVGLPDNILESRLTRLPKLAPAAPAGSPQWLKNDYRILEPAVGRSPARLPLLPEIKARGVLGAALGTLRPGNEPDIMELARRTAQGCIPPRLPRLAAPTLSHGCQLLLDFAETMLPWWDDLHGLAQQVRHVVGIDTVSIYRFDRDPNAAGRWLPDADEEDHWRPVAGRPILLATDFGIQGVPRPRRAPDLWPKFVRRCARAGSPLLVLIPWPRERWPDDLGAHAELMHWHSHTSAAMVRRKLGRGHRVRP